MPIYEFKCNDCDKDFEYLMLKSVDRPECPVCKTGNVRKLMSACGFVSKSAGGQTVSSSASNTSCQGCTAGSCGTCG